MGKKISRREFLKVSATTGVILASGNTFLPIIPNTGMAKAMALRPNQKNHSCAIGGLS